MSASTVLLLVGCALPSLQGRPNASAIRDTGNTRLAQALAPSLTAHPHKSGVHPLPVAKDAFAVRAALADAAERSIDAQYYMWRGDVTGTLLFEALFHAAQRGVRVRLLLDDNNTGGLDHTIAALAAQPNVQVRLFNPLVNRHARWTNYLFDFERVNHRMHNKSFTVENEMTVIGGRNIGDEYFDAGAAVEFVDLDLLAIGPVVKDVSGMFDEFWNSASAYPAQMVVGSAAPVEARTQLEAAFAATHADPRAQAYLGVLRDRAFVSEVREHRIEFQWSDVRLVGDDPAKVFSADRELLLLPRLLEATGSPHSQFDLVSPYFVPMKEGTAYFRSLVQQGVRVRVLTNSLASNDVAAVHAGYAKQREALLKGGVKLYELKRVDSPAKHRDTGSSSGSLHAKTFQIDDAQVFVGSFNFDPRSAKLNTEMGVVIENKAMAEELRSYFDSRMPKATYELQLNKDAHGLQWVETTADGPKVSDTEPGASLLRRAFVGFLSILPIDWLL